MNCDGRIAPATAPRRRASARIIRDGRAGRSRTCWRRLCRLAIRSWPLDWSSPGLLRRLGIGVDALIADNIATYKKNIVVHELGRTAWKATPPAAICRAPLRFETVTLHVDRTALDSRIFDRARGLGAEFIWERVTGVQTAGERVSGFITATGRSVEARWYIDASGPRSMSRAHRSSHTSPPRSAGATG